MKYLRAIPLVYQCICKKLTVLLSVNYLPLLHVDDLHILLTPTDLLLLPLIVLLLHLN